MIKRFKVEKLIRDGICDKLRAKNITVFQKEMDSTAYVKSLGDKLFEEAHEVIGTTTDAERKEELADVLEVVSAFCAAYGYTMEDIVAIQKEKREKNGGFVRRMYCSHVEMEADNPLISYYVKRPKEYPEII